MPTFSVMYDIRTSPWEACAPPQALAHKRVWVRVFQVASFKQGKDALISDHRAHFLTAVAVGVVPARVARIEAQAVGVARVRRVLRGRPVVAARTGIVEAGVVAVARCRQEDAATIDITGEFASFDTIHSRPFIGAIGYLFVLLLL